MTMTPPLAATLPPVLRVAVAAASGATWQVPWGGSVYDARLLLAARAPAAEVEHRRARRPPPRAHQHQRDAEEHEEHGHEVSDDGPRDLGQAVHLAAKEHRRVVRSLGRLRLEQHHLRSCRGHINEGGRTAFTGAVCPRSCWYLKA